MHVKVHLSGKHDEIKPLESSFRQRIQASPPFEELLVFRVHPFRVGQLEGSLIREINCVDFGLDLPESNVAQEPQVLHSRDRGHRARDEAAVLIWPVYID